ncbi:hypothetical protein SELSPUOL_01493 [Selenomonas sputigena ATCC 35185]|uniref:Uncharacterized protein n=1 Tax=Selenomonas sputigena (strain ATCC 35185 / DSM 20758 / CCUG 44933 / VPI D19B-28) TaxID=546271 RepID=C9LVJ9_SELS3|nr:hypothetical protein SELSPUOL_01493 [Selenomonas sputigena ATCC 35185]
MSRKQWQTFRTQDIEKPSQAVCAFGYDLLGLHAKLSGSIFSHHTKLFGTRTQA